jgi:hypothetical protein
VLTAIEDFVDANYGVRLAVLPMFFGVGVLWSESAPWSEAVAALVEPWDRNPVLMRLEHNRVYHLTREFALISQLIRQERVMELMLESRAFGLASRISGVRHGGAAVSWTDQVRDILDAGQNGAFGHIASTVPPPETKT